MNLKGHAEFRSKPSNLILHSFTEVGRFPLISCDVPVTQSSPTRSASNSRPASRYVGRCSPICYGSAHVELSFHSEHPESTIFAQLSLDTETNIEAETAHGSRLHRQIYRCITVSITVRHSLFRNRCGTREPTVKPSCDTAKTLLFHPS